MRHARGKFILFLKLPIYITNSINIITFLSNSEGFGINKDIFETNIINLTIVVGTVVYYGRIACSLLFLSLN
jgi:hypothetical protein